MELASKNLSGTLRMWRERKGIKMESAASELGVATATWAHWEAGRRFPAAKHLTCLSQLLRLPICRLLRSAGESDCSGCNEGYALMLPKFEATKTREGFRTKK